MTRAGEYRHNRRLYPLSSSKIHRVDALNVASRSPKITRGADLEHRSEILSSFYGLYFR
jgi:hypothetical protein